MKKLLLLLLCMPLIFSCGENTEENNNPENTKKQEENIQYSSKTEYDLLKESSTLIGKWKMELLFTPEISCNIEFYNRDSEYFEVQIENNDSAIYKERVINELFKKGDRYLTGNEFGEYYIITKNGDLETYDKEGYLGEDSGGRFIKQ